MPKPTLKSKDNSHAGYSNPDEILFEGYSKNLKAGFLLSVRQARDPDTNEARLYVEVYRADDCVRVRVNGDDYQAPQ